MASRSNDKSCRSDPRLLKLHDCYSSSNGILSTNYCKLVRFLLRSRRWASFNVIGLPSVQKIQRAFATRCLEHNRRQCSVIGGAAENGPIATLRHRKLLHCETLIRSPHRLWRVQRHGEPGTLAFCMAVPLVHCQPMFSIANVLPIRNARVKGNLGMFSLVRFVMGGETTNNRQAVIPGIGSPQLGEFCHV